MIILFSS